MQFSIRAVLLGTTFVAVSLAGIVGASSMIGLDARSYLRGLMENVILAGPVLLPVATAAFAIGRRALTVKTVLFLMVAEAAAFGLVDLLWHGWLSP